MSGQTTTGGPISAAGTSGTSVSVPTTATTTAVVTPTTPATPAAPATPAQPAYVDVKTHPVAQSDVNAMDANQIMDILNNLDVQGVSDAADAHLALGKQLDTAAAQLRKHATTLHGAWSGSAAQAAMGTFQAMHDQTAQLAAQAKQTGQVLQWTAGVMQKYKNLPMPQGQSTMAADQQAGANALSGAGMTGKVVGAAGGTIVGGFMDMIGAGHSAQEQANQTARQYLTSLNNHLISANSALPSPIGIAPAAYGRTPLGPAQRTNAGSNASSGGGGGVASAPPVTGAGVNPATAGVPTTGAAPGFHKFTPAGLPQGGPGSTATLQGYTPPPGGPNTLPPAGTPGGAPVGGPAGPGGGPVVMPGGPVSGVPVPSETLPANNLASDTALPAGETAGANAAADGAVTDAAAEGAAARGGVIGDGMPGMMPGMGGAGGGASAEEMASDQYALREANPDLAAEAASHGVIGDETAAAGAEAGTPMMGGSGSGNNDKERRREAWMAEDADVWGRPADNIPSVIEGGN